MDSQLPAVRRPSIHQGRTPTPRQPFHGYLARQLDATTAVPTAVAVAAPAPTAVASSAAAAAAATSSAGSWQ